LGVGFEFTQGDRRIYSSFFRINPKESAQYEGLAQLLLYFQWNWVGLVANKDDGGERFVSSLIPKLKEKEICLAFTEVMKFDFFTDQDTNLYHIFNTWSKSEVVIFFGDYSCITYVQIVVFAYETQRYMSLLKVWIFTSNWKLNVMNSEYILVIVKPYHGALHFRDHTRDLSEFSHFLLMAGLPLHVLLLFCFLPQTAVKKIQRICALQKHVKFRRQWEFYRPGDLIIGGNLALSTFLGVGFEFTQGERRVYPSFFRINPKESAQYEGLVQLLLHFQWNWVGLVANEDDGGEHFVSSLIPKLKEKEICLAFTEVMKFDFFTDQDTNLYHIFNTWSKSEVVIFFGDYSCVTYAQIVVFAYETQRYMSLLKVWIFTSNWKLNVMNSEYILVIVKPYHGALHFRDHTRDLSEFSHFLLSLDPLKPQDFFLPL
ncbi:hypothetical protein E2320_022102, partial [Naja naja]